jgi:class 3 adenylate cyclase
LQHCSFHLRKWASSEDSRRRGCSKRIYDRRSDTANMAGRTLSTGIPDQIQVTEAFRDPLSEPCNLDFRYQLEMKGAGTVSTYVLSAMSKEAV